MNPYEVLGVKPGDDEETIKKAYRALVKKYHPDRYVNTPMADMATEKLKQINEAYDMLTNKKGDSQWGGHGGQSGYGGYGGYGGQSGYGGYGGARYSNQYRVSFESVRMLLRMRRFAEAEAMLSQLPQNAEWNYLTGLLYINRGWYDTGRDYIKKAVDMDPQNMEYRQTLNSFQQQGQSYRNIKMEYTECCSPGMLPCLFGSLCCSRCCCYC